MKEKGVYAEIFSRREGGKILEDGDIVFFAVKGWGDKGGFGEVFKLEI